MINNFCNNGVSRGLQQGRPSVSRNGRPISGPQPKTTGHIPCPNDPNHGMLSSGTFALTCSRAQCCTLFGLEAYTHLALLVFTGFIMFAGIGFGTAGRKLRDHNLQATCRLWQEAWSKRHLLEPNDRNSWKGSRWDLLQWWQALAIWEEEHSKVTWQTSDFRPPSMPARQKRQLVLPVLPAEPPQQQPQPPQPEPELSPQPPQRRRPGRPKKKKAPEGPKEPLPPVLDGLTPEEKEAQRKIVIEGIRGLHAVVSWTKA